MKTINLKMLATIMQGKLIGEDKMISSVSTDSRTIKSGDLFIAIKGENFDGNKYIAEVKNEGAIAAVISEETQIDIPYILVKDTRSALGDWARYLRQTHPIPMIAVTGSCGKTTTKTMMASIMSQSGKVLATQGTLNNDIGLPLTLLKIEDNDQYAVIEMGTNHFGEISYLTNIAKPNVAVICNIGAAHLEFLGDLQGVARAKGEIFEGLDDKGIAVIPGEDPHAEYLLSLNKNRKVMTFGFTNKSDVFASDIKLDEKSFPTFTLHIANEKISIHLPISGEHNISNALAAAAACFACGSTLAKIKIGLETMQPVAKRTMWYVGKENARIIDDSYNANPTSMYAALVLLSQQKGEKIFAVGDMGEVGLNSDKEHFKLGEIARDLGINSIYAVGKLSQLTAKAFGNNGYHFTDKSALISALSPHLHKDITVLVKGSRSAKMEEVVAGLIEK